jgi:hypothetical protein
MTALTNRISKLERATVVEAGYTFVGVSGFVTLVDRLKPKPQPDHCPSFQGSSPLTGLARMLAEARGSVPGAA